MRDGASDGYYKPRTGIPDSLFPSVRAWLLGVLQKDSPYGLVANIRLLQRIERVLDRPLAGMGRNPSDAVLQGLIEECNRDREYCLSVLDFLISRGGLARWQVAELRETLEEARTLWQIVGDTGSYRLQRIVGPELEAAHDQVMGVGGRPADYLRRAWAQVFGRHPAADGAYRDSIRAIEAAAIAVVSPADKQATLGKIIGELRSNKSKFEVLLHPANGFDGVGAIIAEMDLLWKSQFDRHGTPDDDVPLNVSLEEAEVAVVKATSLVHCLNRGLLRRRE